MRITYDLPQPGLQCVRYQFQVWLEKDLRFCFFLSAYVFNLLCLSIIYGGSPGGQLASTVTTSLFWSKFFFGSFIGHCKFMYVMLSTFVKTNVWTRWQLKLLLLTLWRFTFVVLFLLVAPVAVFAAHHFWSCHLLALKRVLSCICQSIPLSSIGLCSLGASTVEWALYWQEYA